MKVYTLKNYLGLKDVIIIQQETYIYFLNPYHDSCVLDIFSVNESIQYKYSFFEEKDYISPSSQTITKLIELFQSLPTSNLVEEINPKQLLTYPNNFVRNFIKGHLDESI